MDTETRESPGCNPVQEKHMQGRLKQHLSFWEQVLEASSAVLSIIRDRYVLPLLAEPAVYSRPNQQSALENREFVSSAVSELVTYGCARMVCEPPHVCSPLSVLENSVGKKRLVINLRHVNHYLWKRKFKYEDLRVVL